MSVEIVKIDKVGPYGFLSNNVWYGLGKKSELAPDNFVQGQTYSVDVWTADSGKKYVNKIVGHQQPAPTVPGVVLPEIGGRVNAGSNRPVDSDTTQERISRNTAYQKATEAASRMLTPFIAKEEDIIPKLKGLIEPLAQWLFVKIKGETVPA